MKCSQCQNEMTKATTAWICINCGHHEPLDAQPAAPVPEQVAESTPATTTIPAVQAPEQPPVTTQVVPPLPTAPGSVAPAAVAAPQPVQSATTSIPGVTPPKPSKKHRWGLIAALAAILLLGGGLTYAAFYYTSIKPKTALAGYLAKVAQAKSETFKGTVSFYADGQDPIAEAMSATVDGKYDGAKSGDEKVAASIKGKYGKSTFGADVVATQKTVYIKLGKTDLLESFGIKAGEDWYKFDITEADKDKCKDSYNPEAFINQFGIQDIPVKDTKLVNWREMVDGHATAHYKGKVDFGKLQAVVDRANAKLSADCKITYKASDFDGVVVSYDVWEGSSFDRVTINYNNTKDKYRVEITVDTANYNKPVKFDEPTGAKSFESLYGGDSTSSSSSSRNPRDSQRKSDLRNISVALETYYNDKNGYPSATGWLTELTKGGTYLKSIPTDPSTKKNYEYIPQPTKCKNGECTSFSLRATLEDTSDGDIKSGTTATYEVTSVD